MDNNNINSSVLSEHRRVVSTRYILAVINFLAIFAGTVITLFFMSRRGVNGAILTHIWIMFVLNILQIGLCITEYVLRNGYGLAYKWMPPVSYGVGLAWLASLISMMIVGTLKLGTFRTDLAVIAAIQLVVALIAYIFWPMMDRRAINVMISKKIRGDEKKRGKKSASFVRSYVMICFLVVIAQAAALIVYKMPPTFYDLFADTRALEYELNDDGDGYIVTTVYKGTSPKVNIPASYNNLPVVGIAEGALVDENIIEKYQVTEIVFGTETVKEDGSTELVSNLTYIADNSIVNNKIEKLTLPSSIASIGIDAVNSDSLRTIEYSASAEFKYESFANCPSLSKIIMSGDHVGKIISLNGMDASRVTIEVDKDIYNEYREANFEHVKSFRPILDDDEFCIDFFTDCDYYIDSIFCKRGEKVTLNVDSLYKEGNYGIPLSVDTKAYLDNPHELGTNGAKASSAFRGWYTDPSFVSECKFTEEITFDTSTSLYAKWIDEYKADLNWGTFTPTEQPSVLYWTAEDQRDFPVVGNRAGYSAGLVWNIVGGEANQVINTAGITKDVSVIATWILDAPKVSINHELNGAAIGEGTTLNFASFVYDENKVLSLTADHNHALDGEYYNEKTVQYTYEWINANGDVVNKAQLHKLQNVAETGEYTLRVTAHSPWGEVASSEVKYEARISKKPLDIGDARISNTVVTYSATNHTMLLEGAVVSNNVKNTFKYYTVDGENKTLVSTGTGVINAGTYAVELIFEKDNAAEAANYETKVLTATLKVEPKALTFGGWSNDTFVYNGYEREVTLAVGGVLGTDIVEIVYQGNRPKDAGNNYTAVATGITNPNYTLKDIEASEENTHTWSITPKPVTVKNWQTDGNDYASATLTYDGKEHTVYAVIEGVMAGDDVEFVYDTANFSLNTQKNAGKYKAVIVGTTNRNYVFDTSAPEAVMEWEISRRQLAVNYVRSAALVYAGRQQGIMAQISGFADGELEQFTIDMLDISANNTVGTHLNSNNNSFNVIFLAQNVGDYTANIAGLSGTDTFISNYTIEPQLGKTFSIEPKTVTVSASGMKLTYNGAAQEYYLYIDGILAADVELFGSENFTTTAIDVREIDGKLALVYSATNAGSYPTSVTKLMAPSGNYTLSASYSESFTVEPKQIKISEWKISNKADGNSVSAFISGDAFSYNYNGYVVSAVLSGVVSGETVNLQLTDNEKSAVGSYETKATLPASYTNYTFTGSAKVDWQITPYALNISWTVQGGTSSSFVYDGTAKEATPHFSPLGDDTVTLIYSSDKRVGTNAGSYGIVVSGTDNANYTLGKGSTYTWTITPKEITVNWVGVQDLVYNGSYQGPSFSLTGLIASDIAGGELSVTANTDYTNVIDGSGQSQLNFDITSANSYDLATKSFAVDAGNYEIYSLVIMRGSAVDGNYTVKTTSATFEIAPKTVYLTGIWNYTNSSTGTAKFNEGTTPLTYNSKSYSLTTALATGSTVSRLGTPDSLSVEYIGNAAKDAGSYKAEAKYLSGTYAANYKLDSANVTCEWVISPKLVSIVWTANSFVFNGNTQYQNATVASGAANNSDGKIYTGDSYDLTYTGNSARNKGSYTAKVTGITNSNYVVDSSTASYSWSIAPMPVNLSWSYSSTVYNGNVQYPRATVTNKVSGDTVNVSGYAGYESNKVAGTGYTVQATVLDNPNYTLTGASATTATYEITKLVLTYNWYGTYDGSTKQSLSGLVYNAKTLTVLIDFTNVCNNDSVKVEYTTHTFKNAGDDYVVTVTLDAESAKNYELPSAAKKVTFDIAKKPVKINWKWDNMSYATNTVYDNAAHTLIPTLSAIESGDVCEFNTTTQRTSGSGTRYGDMSATDAGTYRVTVTELLNTNYTLVGVSNTSNTITINPQPVKITWTGASTANYDGTAHELTANVVGANDSKNVSFSYESGHSRTAAGTSTFRVSTLNDANYTLSGASGSLTAQLTVKPRVIAVSWYGVKAYVFNPTASYTIYASATNLVEGDSVSFSYSGTRSFSNAGTYTATITATGNANYTLEGASNLSASVTVSAAKLFVKWQDNTTFEYDGAAHSLSATLTDEHGNNVTPVYKNNGQTAAGSYVVSINLNSTDSKNYYLDSGSSATKNMTITKRSIGVVWNVSGNKVYTGSAFNFVPTLTGVIGSDSVTAVCNGSYGTKTDVGTYSAKVISISGTAASNYTLTADPGATLTIRPQAVKITWSGDTEVTYDGLLHELKPTVVGATNGAAVTGFTLSGTAQSAAGNHHYAITAISDPNYTLDGVVGSTTATLVIKQRAVNVSWSDLEQSLLSQLKNPTGTVTNAANGDKIFVQFVIKNALGETVAINSITEAGSYTVEVTLVVGSAAANYTLEGASGATATLVITN